MIIKRLIEDKLVNQGQPRMSQIENVNNIQATRTSLLKKIGICYLKIEDYLANIDEEFQGLRKEMISFLRQGEKKKNQYNISMSKDKGRASN